MHISLLVSLSLYKSSAKDPVPAAKSEIAIRVLGVTNGDDSPLARSATLILWRTIEEILLFNLSLLA
jgi:DNA-binding MurR/RpiR family transcriptional regulator